MKILAFGDILWDVYPDNKYLGGAPLNFAAHLAKHGEDAFLLSALGNDELGYEAKKSAENMGVSLKYTKFLSYDTGRCIVSIDENKIPSYKLLENVAYDFITYDSFSDDFDTLYFGTLPLRSEANYLTLKNLIKNEAFSEIFVDLNLRTPFYSEKTVIFGIKNATILKISSEELPEVLNILKLSEALSYSDAATELSNTYKNLKCILITLGADGAFALNCKTKQCYSCDALKIEVCSTVGAGDSFSAAFLHKYHKNTPLAECLEYASKIASFVVSEFDAVPEYNPNEF